MHHGRSGNKYAVGWPILSVALFSVGVSAAELTPVPDPADYNPLGMTLSHTIVGEYAGTGLVEVMITIQFASVAERITAMGVMEEIPAGWSFHAMGSLNSGRMPDIVPREATRANLGFAWIEIPASFPCQFSYFLLRDQENDGPAAISGQGEYRLADGRLVSEIDTVYLEGKGLPWYKELLCCGPARGANDIGIADSIVVLMSVMVLFGGACHASKRNKTPESVRGH